MLEKLPRAIDIANGICLETDNRPMIAALMNQLLNNKSNPFKNRLLMFDSNNQDPDFINDRTFDKLKDFISMPMSGNNFFVSSMFPNRIIAPENSAATLR